MTSMKSKKVRDDENAELETEGWRLCRVRSRGMTRMQCEKQMTRMQSSKQWDDENAE